MSICEEYDPDEAQSLALAALTAGVASDRPTLVELIDPLDRAQLAGLVLGLTAFAASGVELAATYQRVPAPQFVRMLALQFARRSL